MAIDKSLEALFSQDDFEMSPEGLMVVEPEEPLGDSLTTEMDDGSMVIDFDPMSEMMGQPEAFDSNIAEFIDDNELRTIALDLVGKFDSDKSSRSDWEQTYEQGLDQLGLEIEDRTTPWAGACGVFHPMLSEAVVRFQSQRFRKSYPHKVQLKPMYGVSLLLSDRNRPNEFKNI